MYSAPLNKRLQKHFHRQQRCVLLMHVEEQIFIYATHECYQVLIRNKKNMTLCIFALKGALNRKVSLVYLCFSAVAHFEPSQPLLGRTRKPGYPQRKLHQGPQA